MGTKKSTLADRLADLTNPAPNSSHRASRSSESESETSLGLPSDDGNLLSDAAEDSLSDDDVSEEIGSGYGSEASSSSSISSSQEEDEPPRDSARRVPKVSLDMTTSHRQEGATKAAHVRRQMNFWETLLDARIRMQRALVASNMLPTCQEVPNLQLTKSGDLSKEINRLLKSLGEISDHIGEVRSELLTMNANIVFEQGDTRTQKRKHDKQVSARDMNNFAASIDERMVPYTSKTLEYWANRSALVSAGISSEMSHTLKAFGSKGNSRTHSDPFSDIQKSLERGTVERQRLLDRTRQWRGKPRPAYQASAVTPPITANSLDAELYDDFDHYQTLLRELIESKVGSSNANGKSDDLRRAAIQDAQNTKKTKNVDTKASKGRRLRYDVHEKLQAYMPPMPMGTWHDEQRNELFSGLFGQGKSASSKPLLDERPRQAIDAEFKMFSR